MRKPAPAIALLLLVAVACSVKAPPTRTWTIDPTSGTPSPADPAGPSLGVRSFSIAPEVRTTRLVRRGEGGRLLERATSEEWAAYPDRLLQDATVRALSGSGRFSTVTTSVPFRGHDAVLSVRVGDFSAWASGGGTEARVALRWSLATPLGAPLGDGVAEARAPSSSDAASLVLAFESAARDALSTLVSAVADATTRAPGPDPARAEPPPANR